MQRSRLQPLWNGPIKYRDHSHDAHRAELAISLQPTCPYNQDVLALIDDARDAIRSLEHQADMIVGLRMSGSDTDQLVRELLVAMGSPQ
jgi:hypothetical protein